MSKFAHSNRSQFCWNLNQTNPLLQLSVCTVGVLGFSNTAIAETRLALGEETSPSFLAQVTPDGTTNTTVNGTGNDLTIEQGDRAGGNLFHSFEQFSVSTGGSASFNNAADVSNIFNRVTGGDISNINGTIRANGSANLFLINPAGVVFGEGASLDIGGSFYGSSATSVLFEDGEFSAVDNLEQPILTINAPIGLSFRDNPGEIVNRSTAKDVGLQVATGETISLIGGDVTLEGGLVTAPRGIVELGGLTEAGTIEIGEEGNLSFPDDVARANVFLSNNAVANVTSNGGGLISVNANDLELTGESLFLANIGEGLGSENAVAGTIEINSKSFAADNNSLIQSDNLGTGRAGTVNVTTDSLNFAGGSAITATTFGVGDAGIINVTAQDIAIEQEFSGIYSNVGLTRIASESEELNTEGVVGNGGTINVNTDTLSLLDGARIISSSIAQGDGGAVNIDATGQVLYQGVGETPVPAFGGGTVISGSFSQVQQDGVGNSGEVNITAESLTLIDTGAVLADNSGAGGDAGDITIDVQDNILLDRGALILAQVQGGAVGNGGDININANSLDVLGDSFILADTRGIGNAGNINIDVEETISLDSNPDTDNNTAILTEVQEGGIGNAGNININAEALNIQNGSSIASQTKGEGNGGDVTITATDAISLIDNGQIRTIVETNDAVGEGGNISISSRELNLTNGSEILADTVGLGNAGNININTIADISLDNGNQIQSQTRSGSVGNAGNITITTGGSLFSENGNLILADSQAMGDGGSIIINASEQVVLEGLEENGFPSQIVAGLTREESDGTGGTIEINAGELTLADVAFISSNTTANSTGNAGSITINVDSLNLSENAFINVFTDNDFNAGALTVNAQTLDLASGGKIFAATDDGGNAGNINLNISDRITLDNSVESSAASVEFPPISEPLNDLQNEPSGIYADATENATGDGGNVSIGSIPEQVPENIIVSSDAQIVVSSEGTGSGGNIFLRSENLELNDNATISASTIFGQGGNIALTTTEDITLDNNSLISAEALGNANGGNLTIDSRFIIAFPNGNSDILASAENGLGGNITINTESLLGIRSRSQNDATNDINASSDFNLDGTVNINILQFDPVQGVTELPRNVVETGETAAQACSSDRDSPTSSSFTVTGKGGVPSSPISPLGSSNVIIDGATANSNTATAAPIKTSQGNIQPAMGIEVTDSGAVILTSYRTDNAGKRVPATKRNCI